jgi:hypothetical protein
VPLVAFDEAAAGTNQQLGGSVDNSYGQGKFPAGRGPYGTNLGDIWTMDGSAIGDRLRAQGKIGIHEVLAKDGVIDDHMYVVDENNPDPEMQDLIRRAKLGDDRRLAAEAAQN